MPEKISYEERVKREKAQLLRKENIREKLFEKPKDDVVPEGLDLLILGSFSRFNNHSGEEYEWSGQRYFVHSGESKPYITVDYSSKPVQETIQDLSDIANWEGLPVYGKFGCAPVYAKPNEPVNQIEERIAKTQELCDEADNVLRNELMNMFDGYEDMVGEGKNDTINYAKAKRFVRDNPDFPFRPELVFYGALRAKKQFSSEEKPKLFGLMGRDAKVTEDLLKCLDYKPEYSERNMFEFNVEKIQQLEKRRMAALANKNSNSNIKLPSRER